MSNELTLYNFQNEGAAWLTSYRAGQTSASAHVVAEPYFGMLLDEMGVGKTAQALESIRSLLSEGKRGLFIVPGATTVQWQKNWNRWINDIGTGDVPDEWCMNQLARLTGTLQPVPHDASVVMSHAMLARHAIVKKLVEANFDFLVIDEVHKFGNRKSKRFRNLLAVLNLSESRLSYGRIVLTGTPTRNWAHEIYSVCHIVAPQYARNFEEFAGRWLAYYDKKSLRDPIRFHEYWKPFMLRRTLSQVAPDMPPCRRTKLYTELTSEFIRKTYNKNVSLMKNFMESGEKVDSTSLLGYLQKLRHITGLGKTREAAIMEPIIEYLTAASPDGSSPDGRKAVIGVHHIWVVDRLRLVLSPVCKVFAIVGGMDDSKKEQVKQEFITYSAPAVLLLSIKAGGEGIDGLQHACTKSYVFERQWNGADEQQFEKRIYRIGQTKKVEIEYTLALGTVDEFFDEMVEHKRKITNSVSDPNWESDPAFIRELANKVIANPLSAGSSKRGNYSVDMDEASPDDESGELELAEISFDELELIDNLQAQTYSPA